jgi:hypothetical protein
MANWCSNTVAFEGNETALEQIKLEFRKMMTKEEKENCGQLPEFISENNRGYFFDIVWEEVDCIFNYQTKWSPNTETLMQIAKRFKVDFICDFEEMGNLIYSRTIFSDNKLTDIYLEDVDFEKYQYDEETEIYHFEEKTYDNDYEILEILLERKINVVIA